MTDKAVHKYVAEARKKFDNAMRSYQFERKNIEKYIDVIYIIEKTSIKRKQLNRKEKPY